MEVAKSYAYCHELSKKSGSNFYRSFALLSQDRRNAMMALYAFARLADDAADDVAALPGNEVKPVRSEFEWSADKWHAWIDALPVAHDGSIAAPSDACLECLKPIEAALADSVRRFSIPLSTLHDLILGVAMDVEEKVQLANWGETRKYCLHVASSVGVACLSIWAKEIGVPPDAAVVYAANDCGVAFQLTNILRDLAEDAQRGRIYLPADELRRFGIDPNNWLQISRLGLNGTTELGDWRGVMRLQIERAKALYESGWQVADNISLDGKRMFSLMWHTYRALLAKIEKSPESVWSERVRLSKWDKLVLVKNHVLTPAFHKLVAERKAATTKPKVQNTSVWPEGGARVAVVGAGLAGLNATMHLARHGCKVTLFESKNRLGGRVGSFTDHESSQSIDYCQHVGMYCCTTLRQWIVDTQQTADWDEQSSLHFVSATGKKITVRGWPLPAPFHLTGLLLQWPQLRFTDRCRVAYALLCMQRLKSDASHMSTLAIDWLTAHGQNQHCLRYFWSTILVSALGEQVDRVTLGAARKVLVDGFAAHPRAFHLLVPNRPLSEILEDRVRVTLNQLDVELRLGETVKRVQKTESGTISIASSSIGADEVARAQVFDSVVIALPWNKVSGVLANELRESVKTANELQSSPITGVHTWWDRGWLLQPHGILIDRLCQWVFPAPGNERHKERDELGDAVEQREHYYQIVISASRDLPRGDNDSVLKAIQQDLAVVFPESANAKLIRGKVVTDPNAVFSVAVGHESSRLAADTLAEQSIWLAGDWTQTQWPATMEGALRSGALAAQGVLSHFHRDAMLFDL